MKQKFLYCLFIALTSIASSQFKVQFITVNGYGNNLYLDNLSLGTQFNNDVGVASINNILSDTSYAVGTSAYTVIPNVTFINTGRTNITSSFNVTMVVLPGVYSSTKSISSLNSGQTIDVNFDNLTITPGNSFTITVSTNLSGDENPANNTLNQFTHIFPGYKRNVLLEEWTSSTCGPCAASNPTVDAFIASKFDSLVPIKYHMNWPSPGNDPMYLYNPSQNNDRRYYYGINAVPTVIMDGVVYPSYPYSNPSSLPTAFDIRKPIGTPLKVSVVNTRLPGDTIQAVVTINIAAPLPAGNYNLRVHAVERAIKYATPPGTNGEKDFYDVFRKAYPNSVGTSIPTAVGNYNFTFKYKLDLSTWIDSLIYTAAFVQNDATKEVLNCGKSRNILDVFVASNNQINEAVEKPILAEQIIYSQEEKIISSSQEKLANVFHYTLFEEKFPSGGWTVKNPDNGMTFEQFKGANGPSFGGQKSVTLQFYNYSATNQTDTLISKTFDGLTSNDTLKFNWAYAMYSASYVDRLIVRVSTNGGQSWQFTIFDKSGTDLATAPTTTNAFIPADASQWKTFVFALNNIIPVELTSFNAKANGNNVELNWSTATETNNRGFEIQRKENDNFITVGFLKGKGTTTSINNYSYTDKDVPLGKYQYRLKQIDLDGTSYFSNSIEVDIAGFNVFFLEQNYPNPFSASGKLNFGGNTSTRIKFNLPNESKVTLKLFNLLGEELMVLLNKDLPAGLASIDFNASQLKSGVYFYQLDAAGNDGRTFSAMKKMTIIK